MMPPPRKDRRAKQAPPSAAALLSEAGRLKQRAERESEGAAKESLLAQCAALLQHALSSSLSFADQEAALFDLGEVYALCANSTQHGMYAALGNIFNGKLRKIDALNIQLDALERSANFYRKSHEMYEKILSRDSSQLKQEARVNSGNSLCEWADICIELPANRGGGEAAAANLYMQADLRYSTALSAAQNDVELLTNFGDCAIKRAEIAVFTGSGSFSEAEPWMIAKTFYSKAMDAYGHACGLADASKGDDLAGLLQNWGAGWLSLAERTPDNAEAAVAFKLALEKLRNAAKFHPTDVTIFVAIGEVYCTQAEKLDKLQALESLVCATEEGFGMALKINSTCLDAIIGKGEAHLAAGRLAVCIEKHSLAEEHFTQSIESYMKAVQMLKADVRNECNLKFEEQCDLLFNLGCVAAICNQENVAADSLSLLVQVEGISGSELAEDADLQGLKMKEWFVALLQRGI